jgi:cytoskeletal protein CcmA (bactofilin family)
MLEVNGILRTANDLYVNQNAHIGGNINVSQLTATVTSFLRDVTTSSGLYVGDNLQVTGSTNLRDATISSGINTNTLQVTGSTNLRDATISSGINTNTLQVTGSTNLGDATTSSGLDVGRSCHISGGLQVDANGGHLVVYGDSTHVNDLHVGNDLFVNSDTTIGGNLQVNGKATINGSPAMTYYSTYFSNVDCTSVGGAENTINYWNITDSTSTIFYSGNPVMLTLSSPGVYLLYSTHYIYMLTDQAYSGTIIFDLYDAYNTKIVENSRISQFIHVPGWGASQGYNFSISTPTVALVGGGGILYARCVRSSGLQSSLYCTNSSITAIRLS